MIIGVKEQFPNAPWILFHPVNLKQQTDFVTCSSKDTEAGVDKKTGVDKRQLAL